MIPLYAICVALGVLGMLGWVTFGLAAGALEGRADLDPEARFGTRGRTVVAVVLGFGLGGMSAAFGGWGSIPAFLAALGGAAIGIVAVRYLGVEEENGEPG